MAEYALYKNYMDTSRKYPTEQAAQEAAQAELRQNPGQQIWVVMLCGLYRGKVSIERVDDASSTPSDTSTTPSTTPESKPAADSKQPATGDKSSDSASSKPDDTSKTAAKDDKSDSAKK